LEILRYKTLQLHSPEYQTRNELLFFAYIYSSTYLLDKSLTNNEVNITVAQPQNDINKLSLKIELKDSSKGIKD
jgi:hypothetical protein